MPDVVANDLALEHLKEARAHGDSVGGIMECKITGLPAGLGDTVFEKLDANLAKAIMSIGAVKAVEIGDGANVSSQWGSMNNDAFYVENDAIIKRTNHAGGILGGISDGSDVIIKAYFKPTPSIFQEQETVNKKGEDIKINIKGRHDPIVVTRAVVVVEAMTAITILDSLLQNMTSRLDGIKNFYRP